MNDEILNSQIASFYANGAGINFSENDCRLVFGKSSPTISGKISEEVEIYLSHRTLKQFIISARTVLEHFEERSGLVISVDQTKIDMLHQMLKDADAAMDASATA